MGFNATNEVNKRYEEYKKNNGSSEVFVASFDSVPILGEDINSYIEYISNNSIRNIPATNKVGEFMRKLNNFWFKPILTKQDTNNSALRQALIELSKSQEINRELNNRVAALSKRLDELTLDAKK